jgi:hypothetical protein
MHPPKIQETGNDRPIIEGQVPEEGTGAGDSGSAGETMARPRPSEGDAEPDCAEVCRPLPPGEHPYDPIKKDLDPIGFALYRIQTFLAWIGEHRAAFEQARDNDKELAEAELSNLRHATSQARLHLQRLSELLLAGYTIDPGKRLPESLRRGWFSSYVGEHDGLGRAPEAETSPGNPGCDGGVLGLDRGADDSRDRRGRNAEPAPDRGDLDESAA